MIKKVGVFGATGMIGKPVTKELVSAGFEISVFVRNEEKARKIFNRDVKYFEGDIYDAGSIKAFLAGQDAIYINLNLRQDESISDKHDEKEGLGNILSAARDASLKRVAFISSIVMNYQGMNGFNWWVFEVKKQAIEQVKRSGIPYAIFYPSAFMENFEGNYRQGNRLLLAGRSEEKMFFISAKDFGRQVARSFAILDKENKEYVVQGPQAFTVDEATQEYLKYYQKERLAIAKAPLQLIKFFGFFSRKMNYAGHIIEALNRYPEKFEGENTWAELGRPEITLRQHAETAGA